MKRNLSFRVFTAVLLIATLLQIAAVSLPADHSLMATSSTLVRLTISNKSGETVYLRLEGPTVYILPVPSYTGEKIIYTVKRGIYKYSLDVCDLTAIGTIDLTHQQLFVIPVCRINPPRVKMVGGVRANVYPTVRIVGISITNRSNDTMLVILTGETKSYAFWISAGATRDYTIYKGEYAVEYRACGETDTTTFWAYHNSKLRLYCPEP